MKSGLAKSPSVIEQEGGDGGGKNEMKKKKNIQGKGPGEKLKKLRSGTSR